ncbi:MAG TPA: cytochrome c-type biogenesis protein CcmH, partial [Gemmatimonadaceae bacterium]|nr:cytochrome c-type biogenesis protein CcmH [Gemmatimonadaceae bacterium]
MDPTAARSVRLAPKPGASPSMTPDERDALEHRIRCQCGCTLDVFTCRTTDFSCQVSPAMHRDVLALVEGGHSAQEILDAFVNVYGERALMAPTKTGFNLVGYILPGAAIAAGAILL